MARPIAGNHHAHDRFRRRQPLRRRDEGRDPVDQSATRRSSICRTSIPPQDIRAGAIVLAETARWFPPDTIHVAVVDPGVGSNRRIVYARIGSQHFIAPDNGLLSRLAHARTAV